MWKRSCLTFSPRTLTHVNLQTCGWIHNLETLVCFLIGLLLLLGDCAGRVTLGFTVFHTIAVG